MHDMASSLMIIRSEVFLISLKSGNIGFYDKFRKHGMMYRFNVRKIVMLDLILYVPSTIFHLNKDGSSWVEPVLS